ncbi:MAG TPA: cation transporting ATPase C-terminal domain-containing protein, partial [Chitinophagaceae bacterium]
GYAYAPLRPTAGTAKHLNNETIFLLLKCTKKGELTAGITILFILSLLYIPFVQQLFRLIPLSFSYLMICIAVALVSTFWIEILKLTSSQPFFKGEGQKSSPLERI